MSGSLFVWVIVLGIFLFATMWDVGTLAERQQCHPHLFEHRCTDYTPTPMVTPPPGPKGYGP